jgi:hypothetical protein
VPDIAAIQSVFNKGELTPKLHARVDSPYYKGGLKECVNYHVLVQGGLAKRTGTKFVGVSIRDTIGNADHSRLVPFVFSETQAYVLEFGDYQLAFYIKGAPVTTVPGGTTRYTIPTIYPVTALKDLAFVQTADIVYLTHPDYPVMKLLRYGETDWRFEQAKFVNGPFLDLNVKTNVAFATGTTRPSITASADANSADAAKLLDEIPATYWLAERYTSQGMVDYDLGSTPYACAGYVIIAAKYQGDGEETEQRFPYMAPRKWKVLGSNDKSTWVLLDQRRAEANWQASETREYYFSNDRKFRYYRLQIEANNGDRKTLAVGTWQLYLKDRPGTLVFENTTNINSGTGFGSGDVGRIIKWQGEDGFWRYFTVTGVQNATSLTGTWTGFWTFSQDRTQNWALGAYSKASGYPRAATIFQERLCLGGTYAQPRTVHMSASGDYEDYEVPDKMTDAAPISVTMAGARRDRIEWLREVEDLLMCATTDNIASLGGTENAIMSPTNVRQRRHAGFGTAIGITPIRVGSVLLFVGNHNNSLHELVYSAQTDGYEAPAVSVLADHLYASGIAGVSFAQTPHDMAYLYTDDGEIIALAYEREQQVVGHSRFIFPQGKIRSLCVIPEDRRDALYVLVERETNGIKRHFVERLEKAYEYAAGDVPFWYLDSALSYSGAPTTVITGLGHLEGHYVRVYGYDETTTFNPVVGPHAAKSSPELLRVTNGQIVLPYPITYAVIGLPYDAYFRLLPHAIDERDGSTLGRKQRVDYVIVNLMETHSLAVQSGDTTLPVDDILLRKGEQEMDQWTPLFTGSIDVPVEDTWDARAEMTFSSNEPFPCIVRALTLVVDREPGAPARFGG